MQTQEEREQKMNNILAGLRHNFKEPQFRIERGKGDRLLINGAILKGVLFYPGSSRMSEEWEIDTLSGFIRSDIDSGRFVANETI